MAASLPEESPPEPTESAPRPRRWRGFAVGLAAGLVAATGVVLMTTQATREWSGQRPRLTREAYEQASRLWDEHAPVNYQLDIEVTGNRPGKIHVEVRDGQAVHMLRDGAEPQQRRTWYYWTVPGMLDTIGQELDKVDDPEKGFGAPAGSEVILRAKFDKRVGFPSSYSRVVAGQNLDMGWTINAFISTEVIGPVGKRNEKAATTEEEAESDPQSKTKTESDREPMP
jgi:Family of unknown function (DUF6174)